MVTTGDELVELGGTQSDHAADVVRPLRLAGVVVLLAGEGLGEDHLGRLVHAHLHGEAAGGVHFHPHELFKLRRPRSLAEHGVPMGLALLHPEPVGECRGFRHAEERLVEIVGRGEDAERCPVHVAEFPADHPALDLVAESAGVSFPIDLAAEHVALDHRVLRQPRGVEVAHRPLESWLEGAEDVFHLAELRGHRIVDEVVHRHLHATAHGHLVNRVSCGGRIDQRRLRSPQHVRVEEFAGLVDPVRVDLVDGAGDCRHLHHVGRVESVGLDSLIRVQDAFRVRAILGEDRVDLREGCFRLLQLRAGERIDRTDRTRQHADFLHPVHDACSVVGVELEAVESVVELRLAPVGGEDVGFLLFRHLPSLLDLLKNRLLASGLGGENLRLPLGHPECCRFGDEVRHRLLHVLADELTHVVGLLAAAPCLRVGLRLRKLGDPSVGDGFRRAVGGESRVGGFLGVVRLECLDARNPAALFGRLHVDDLRIAGFSTKSLSLRDEVRNCLGDVSADEFRHRVLLPLCAPCKGVGLALGELLQPRLGRLVGRFILCRFDLCGSHLRFHLRLRGLRQRLLIQPRILAGEFVILHHPGDLGFDLGGRHRIAGSERGGLEAVFLGLADLFYAHAALEHLPQTGGDGVAVRLKHGGGFPRGNFVGALHVLGGGSLLNHLDHALVEHLLELENLLLQLGRLAVRVVALAKDLLQP